MNGNNLGGILSNNTLAWKKLCEWSQMNTATVIFDSDIDSHEHVQFVHRILNKDNLYFIVEDDARNIFGYDYLLFRFGYRGSVRIARPNTHNSYCYNLSEGYNGLNDLSLTGNNSPTQFDVTRIIVIQMQ
ncbi:TLDc domain-containing protein [Entamoeba marina]